jgi:D-arginine dehydrogenase
VGSNDAVIVGAGLAGCSVAWHLAGRASVLLLDQGLQAGAEASSQNAGMVRRLGEDPYERLLAVRTHAWLEDPGPDWSGLDPSRRTGALIGLGEEPHELHDAASHLVAQGVRVEACDRPAELAPALAGAPILSAWHLPDERVADAHALITGFLRGARARHAEVRLRCRVLGLRRDGDRIVGVNTEEGPIDAGQVVLAAGAWSSTLAAGIGLHRPLVPLRRTLLQTAPHPLSHPDHPWCWVDDVGIYARPEAGGFLVSPCDEAIDPPSNGPGSRGSALPFARALADAKLRRWMPALADARLEGGWTGLRTFAPDRRPVLGPDPDVEGLHWAAGLGGFGVTCGYAVGEAVAGWLVGDAVPWLDADAVSPGRGWFSRWLIRPDGDRNAPRFVSTAGPAA